jgi:hypothetical protein
LEGQFELVCEHTMGGNEGFQSCCLLLHGIHVFEICVVYEIASFFKFFFFKKTGEHIGTLICYPENSRALSGSRMMNSLN